MSTSREGGVDIVCGGSYRHVKDFCGDLDIIITHRDRNSLKGLYPKFVKHLDDMTVLRGDLVSAYIHAALPDLDNSTSFFGVYDGHGVGFVQIQVLNQETSCLLNKSKSIIQVIVDAVVNSGPREDATRIGSTGVVRRQAVDISPLRRVNQAIYLLTTGARESAFRNIKTIVECLADELINAAKGSSNSYAIKKKDAIERVAKANGEGASGTEDYNFKSNNLIRRRKKKGVPVEIIDQKAVALDAPSQLKMLCMWGADELVNCFSMVVLGAFIVVGMFLDM
uniref:40S ribosomal protein S5-like n=1 Tax=Fragaria vesca subsp. vesca TaxID=101020 RepID=UPI0005C9BCB3|nr:PREDICTED: 40S ribosomal protein S5-like [Fragaria vesca subsp. vesca]